MRHDDDDAPKAVDAPDLSNLRWAAEIMGIHFYTLEHASANAVYLYQRIPPVRSAAHDSRDIFETTKYKLVGAIHNF